MKQQNKNGTTDRRAYIPPRNEAGPECRFDSFGPSQDVGAPLWHAGFWWMGIDRLRGHFRGGSDCCETHLLYAVMSGRIECESGSKPRTVQEGEMLIAPARGPHWIRLGTAPCRAVWIHLRQTSHWDFLREAGQHVQKLLRAEELESATEFLLQAARTGEPAAADLVFHYSEILLICLARELQDLQRPAERELRIRFVHLWNAVRRDPAHPWTVPEMAKQVGLAPGYLPDVCRRQFGVTPMEQVAAIRMDGARHLLAATNLTMAEIARRVGYATEYAFSNAFKRVTGLRPGAVRRRSVPRQA